MKFTDTEGRSWNVTLNVWAMKSIRDALDIDLLSADQKVFEKLGSDPVTLCNVLYVVCSAQAEKMGVSDEDFGRGLSGDVIADATQALLGALADFFPSPKRRALIRKVVARLEELDDRVLDLQMTEFSDERLTAMMDEVLAKVSVSGSASTNTPPSPASETLDP